MAEAVLERLMTRVMPELLAHLRSRTSAFRSAIAQRQLEGQVRVALQDALTELGLELGAAGPEDHTFDELIGRERAGHQVHPSESLIAVTALFDLAFPAVSELAPRIDAVELGRVLHRSIMRRLVPAAVGYVDVLLNQVHEAQMESRLKLAQDLHDRIAHGVGVGVQGIQIATLLLPEEPEAALARLSRTEGHLTETLEMVRELSGKLREAVGSRSLAQALREYLSVTAPPTIGCAVTAHGDLNRLPQFVIEESYLILREAARNALLHAEEATSLHITIEIGDGLLRAQVIDDGAGFDPAEHPESTGLRSMHERARLIQGALTLASARGRGTTVQLRVPVNTTGVTMTHDVSSSEVAG
jgi:signal transduction histidine kinase